MKESEILLPCKQMLFLFHILNNQQNFVKSNIIVFQNGDTSCQPMEAVANCTAGRYIFAYLTYVI